MSATKTLDMFSVLSDLDLLTSSIMSFTALIAKTIVSGNRIDGLPSVMLTNLITYKVSIIKKYALFIFENYRYMFLGRKLNQVYFEVFILLLINLLFFLSGCVLISNMYYYCTWLSEIFVMNSGLSSTLFSNSIESTDCFIS